MNNLTDTQLDATMQAYQDLAATLGIDPTRAATITLEQCGALVTVTTLDKGNPSNPPRDPWGRQREPLLMNAWHATTKG